MDATIIEGKHDIGIRFCVYFILRLDNRALFLYKEKLGRKINSFQ